MPVNMLRSDAIEELMTVGRRKINIVPIEDDRSRQVTFTKRKNGLMKKAMELSVLCNCRIGLVLFDGNGRLYDFTTEDMRSLIADYFSKEIYESNTREELYRRYNAKEAVQAAAHQALRFERKPDSASPEAEKTDESGIEVESNSDINNSEPCRAVSAPSGQKAEARRNLRSSVRAAIRERAKGRETQPVAVARPFGAWPSVAALPASYVQGASLTTGLEPNTVFSGSTIFKEEPYSASQQILRLEDSPPFMMSIPRQDTDGVYGMPVPSMASDATATPEQLYMKDGCPGNCPISVLNPETRKILDMYGSIKTMNLPPTLMTSPTGRMVSGAQQEMPSMPGHPPYPYFDSMPDARLAHLGGIQPYPIDSNFTQNAMSDAAHDAMCLQNLFRPGSSSYSFPSSSHNAHP